MMKWNPSPLALLACLVACPPAGGQDGPHGPRPLKTAEDAARHVKDVLRVTASPAAARAAPGPGLARIPFVAVPSEVWRLTGKSEAVLPKNRNLSGFEVTLDPASGALVAWQSVPSDGAATLEPPIPDRAALEARMAATDSRYVGLVAAPPKLGVPELLARAAQQGFADLEHAHEVRIKRVMMATRGGAPAPVWVINLRGTRPVPGKGPAAGLPESERSHLRLVYDEGGTLLFADNLLE